MTEGKLGPEPAISVDGDVELDLARGEKGFNLWIAFEGFCQSRYFVPG